eukprot:gnl/TRDRNA2_/TRDRNA2_155038_c0_seq1.p1 gnl/TRDRNA2_/TRDRNA2_155038_c0~~gnl/TRDRNA2_/TRDRNA2_155038_c0_seq1.p1  ORF type:complete len:171 (+),score=49.54 gnl/TRDRNA2_/TRDRNA2_155038_c0_seq1:81-593(+)
MVQLTARAHGKAVLIAGDTMSVKDLLKAQGGSWNKGMKGWIFPGGKHQAIVSLLRGQGHEVADSFGEAAAPAEGAEVGAATNPPAKKQKTSTSQGDDKFFVPLGDSEKQRVTVSTFNGRTSVDIREWWADKDAGGEMKPGKKGLTLDRTAWEELKKSIPRIDAELQRLGA